MVREVKPIVCGFPGLPPWLDLPMIKRTARDYGVTEEEAREHLRLNTVRELPTARGENRGNNERGTETCIRVDRQTLSQEPSDAPEISPEDGG